MLLISFQTFFDYYSIRTWRKYFIIMIIIFAGQDFLHQDLNNRLLAHNRETGSAPLGSSPYLRTETHQHQHQHSHLHNHQHMHQHTYTGIGPPPSLVPTPPPHLVRTVPFFTIDTIERVYRRGWAWVLIYLCILNIYI